jgi:DNA-binding Lrp family transcriptional regulator
MRQLDERDRQILALLRENARLPLKALAAKVGLARSSLRDRLARLEAEGVIRGYQADIAPDIDAGVGAYLQLRLKRTPALDFIADLKRIPGIRGCASVAGDIDLILHLEAASIDRLNALRDEIARHPAVADITTSIILRWDIGGAS